MPPRIRVNPQEEVKLVLFDFDGTVQVARLEHTIEDILILSWQGGVHPLECPVIDVLLIVAVLRHFFLLYRQNY